MQIESFNMTASVIKIKHFVPERKKFISEIFRLQSALKSRDTKKG